MLQRFVKSFVYAFSGLRYVFREEENFYIQTILGGLVVGAGIIFEITQVQWLFLILAIGLVLGSEILNTILEDVCNEIHPDHHPMIGKIKDMMAAFVLLNSIIALAIGLTIFLPLIF